MSAAKIAVHGVHKAFSVPRERRSTLRDHVLGAFTPRRVETLRVLRGVTFSVGAGETLGILGRNGSGKSTLLRVLCGIYRPDAGAVEVRGCITPVLELGVGWHGDLDAVDNAELFGTLLGRPLREVRAGLPEVFAFAELERFAGLELRHFSHGMAARLAFSVAMQAVPDILVLDEIFSVGDAPFRRRCELRFRELRRAGSTILLVSHDPYVVAENCERAILLRDGRVAFDGPAAECVARYLETPAAELVDPPRAGEHEPDSDSLAGEAAPVAAALDARSSAAR